MSKARNAVDLGDGVRIECVKGRVILRLHHGDLPVEVPLAEVLEQLGVRAADVMPSGPYLLFAGDAWPSGGVGDLVAVYSSEDEARDAFRRLRLLPAARNGWAQLVAVRPNGRLDHLSWFGREPAARAAARRQPVEAADATARRGRLRRRALATVPDVEPDEAQKDEPARPPGQPPRPLRAGPDVDDVSPMAAMLSTSLAHSEPPRTAPATGRPRRPRPGQRR